ncbi:MAG TPA: hemolysin III family protein [Bdellovibrio sp.]|nr:hemolysin III family protein [Bdellovibrio sp.]
MKIAVQDGERFNTFSHLIGTMLAFGGVCLLMCTAMAKHDMLREITCAIYSLSTLGIYAISTLYHGSVGPRKDILRKMDYIGIYFKIAGNYTPFMILAIQGLRGWAVVVAIWSFAVGGILMELYLPLKSRFLPNIVYLIMSSMVLFVIHVLVQTVAPEGFALIMLGFLSYAVGFYFFLNDERIPHGHGIWHMFVIGGSLCQYLCLLMFIV